MWISHVQVAANDLFMVKELLTNCQIANHLVRGLKLSWSNVLDAIVYTATEMSLEDIIGAMEAHKISLNGNKATNMASDSVAYIKCVACSNCGKHGHQSNNCPKPKNFGKTKAGATTAVKLGDYESGSYNNNNKVNMIY
ncbi:hypothetical protein PTTG_30441, partial [Puccinia triticina 1-1 BBBD Race 1]